MASIPECKDQRACYEWDGLTTIRKMDVAKNGGTVEEFVTVVSVDGHPPRPPTENFVTVLSIGNDTSNDKATSKEEKEGEEGAARTSSVKVVGAEGPLEEEVEVYRLPGERLGFGLKFEGGNKTSERVRRLFVQSCAEQSPASRARCSWGTLGEGDEVTFFFRPLLPLTRRSRSLFPGALDRRGAGDAHDPTGLRETIEGVAAGDQADGEVQGGAQARGGERGEEELAGEQGAARAALGAPPSPPQKVEAGSRLGRRGGEPEPRRQEIVERRFFAIKQQFPDELAVQFSKRLPRLHRSSIEIGRGEQQVDLVRELRVLASKRRREIGAREPEGIPARQGTFARGEIETGQLPIRALSLSFETIRVSRLVRFVFRNRRKRWCTWTRGRSAARRTARRRTTRVARCRP